MDSYLQTLKCAQVAGTTHLSMVGGKYRVDDPASFHKVYATHHARGKGTHLVEKVRYPSKWYLDVDHVDVRRLNTLLTILLARGEPCVVCTPIESKDGIHVIFTEGYVYSKEDACAKSDALLRNTSIVFDKSVYSSGLRMVGSKKGHAIDRVYMPYYRVNGKHNGCNIKVGEPLTPVILAECSIHYHGPVDARPPGNKPTTVLRLPPAPTATTNAVLQLGFIHPAYAHIHITKIQKTIGKAGVPGYFLFTKERYCTHLEKEHKSATVCFEITNRPVHTGQPKTIRNRCTCKCAHTGCAAFRGHAYPIPIKLLRDIIHIHTTLKTQEDEDCYNARDNDRIDRDFFDALA